MGLGLGLGIGLGAEYVEQAGRLRAKGSRGDREGCMEGTDRGAWRGPREVHGGIDGLCMEA